MSRYTAYTVHSERGNGGAEESRTPDLRIANATLCQLSYRPGNIRLFVLTFGFSIYSQVTQNA